MGYGVTTAYRLVIEGLGLEAVTDPEMERLAPDGWRRRVRGLRREGLRISEQCDPVFAEIEASGMTVSIVDRQHDEVWCSWLAQQPQRRTWLTADLDGSSTTVTVASTEGLAVDGVIHVGTETMFIDSVDSTTQLTVQRGQADTIAQYHYTDDGDSLSWPLVALTHPITLEGRRAYLYRYADEDSLQGDGTLIWRGVCSTDARIEDDGGTWTLTLDSIVTILKQPIASDIEEPLSLRGAYYPPGYGFSEFSIFEMQAYDVVDESRRSTVTLVGHFETQDNFCAAMQALIRASMDPLTGDLTAVDITAWESTGYGSARVVRCFDSASRTDIDSVFVLPVESGWQVSWTADALLPAHLVVGLTGDNALIDGGDAAGGVLGNILRADYDTVSGAAPTANELLSVTTLRGGMPRALWGIPSARWADDPDPDLSRFDLFVNTTTTAMSGLTVEWKDGGDPESFAGGADADATLGRLRYRYDGTVTGLRYSYPGRDVEIRPQRLIASGNLADFRDGLVALAPELANRGALPFVTTNDLASWTTVVEEAAGGRPFTTRNYATAGEVELSELVAHDCRLLSVFPALDADGKITLKHLRLPTGTSVGDFDITAAETVVSDVPPVWERNAIYGSINQVKIKTRYNIIEEEHTGTTYIVRDVTAQSVRKAPKELEIAPLSSELVFDSRVWSYDLAVSVARRVLGLFGRPYSVVTVQVPHTLLATALCGTVGVLTSPRIPDPTTGERGVTRKGGLVIGREWDLATEVGTLTMIVADSPIAGYAPSVFVSSSAVVSGNQYDLVVTFDDPSGASMAPSGAALSDFYSVGDTLVLLVWDSTTQGAQGCVVDAIDDGTGELRVTFGAPPTLTGTRYLAFATYDDSGLTSSQRRFAFFADASALLDDGDGGFDSAREYSA